MSEEREEFMAQHELTTRAVNRTANEVLAMRIGTNRPRKDPGGLYNKSYLMNEERILEHLTGLTNGRVHVSRS